MINRRASVLALHAEMAARASREASLPGSRYNKRVICTNRRSRPVGIYSGNAAPPAVGAARGDAVLIVTPEFNHGIPGVLKNTLDWLSRPAFTSCMQGKPVLFITLSPGAPA
ncbi:NADPH-dependent FMN reductase [Sodalis sp. RH21]|uniref:NADPH-dependent FMN reductase n=1 Tax=unclassified Sodalis (in: enterobacteria) TaxID=2636512 RepID=UPI0039B52597